jgi:transposase InsO family protein
VYQIDATQIDVLVQDTYTGYRKKSGEVRPWLTLCAESFTGALVSAQFGYDPPNQFTVAGVIRDALLQEGRVIGGIPDEIRVDHGKAMISRHIQQIAADYGIVLNPCYIPEHKGKVERKFGTLNTRLRACLDGKSAHSDGKPATTPMEKQNDSDGKLHLTSQHDNTVSKINLDYRIFLGQDQKRCLVGLCIVEVNGNTILTRDASIRSV